MTPDVTKPYASKPIDSFIPRSPYGATNHSIILKVMEDIRFLEDRITRMKNLQTPNATVLKTYQTMLDSRESVLAWLKENDNIDAEENDDPLSHCG